MAKGTDIIDIDPTHPSTVITKELRVKPTFTFAFKIAVGFFQIVTSLSNNIQIPWPSYFVTFLGYFSFLSFDLLPWPQLECLVTPNYYQKYVAATVLPPVILIAVGVFIGLYLIIAQCIPSLKQQNKHRRAMWRLIYWRLILFANFILYAFFLSLLSVSLCLSLNCVCSYPGISAKVLAYYNCTDVNGSKLLVADMTVSCSDHQYKSFLPYALAMTLIVCPFFWACFVCWLFLCLRAHFVRVAVPDRRAVVLLHSARNQTPSAPTLGHHSHAGLCL